MNLSVLCLRVSLREQGEDVCAIVRFLRSTALRKALTFLIHPFACRYVKLTVDGQAATIKKQTKVCTDGGSDPVWDESVFLDIVDQYDLVIEVMRNQSEPPFSCSCSSSSISSDLHFPTILLVPFFRFVLFNFCLNFVLFFSVVISFLRFF